MRQTARMANAPVVLENLSHQVLAFDPAGASADHLLDRWESRSRRVQVARPHHGYDAAQRLGGRHRRGPRNGLGPARPRRRRPAVRTRPGARRTRAATLALGRLVEREQESLERQTHRTLLGALRRPDADRRTRSTCAPRGSACRWRARRWSRSCSGPAQRPDAVARGPGPAPAAGRVGRRLAPRSPGARPRRRARRRHRSACCWPSPTRSKVDAALDTIATRIRRSVGDEDPARARGDRRRLDGHRRPRGPTLLPGGGPGRRRGRRRRRPPLLPARRRRADRAAAPAARTTSGCRPTSSASSGRCSPTTRQRDRPRWPSCATTSRRGATSRRRRARSRVSRPSFYERLHAIEEVLGVDLDDVATCLSLHVAVAALDAVRSPG